MKSFVKLIAIGSIFFSQALFAQTYTWVGATSNEFDEASNWTPARAVPASTDRLVFSTGGTLEVTDMNTQTTAGFEVSNNTQLTLSATITNKILTVEDGQDTDFIVANGSSLTVKNNGGVRIDVEMGANVSVEVGGTIIMEKGTFDLNNASLTLHTNTTPLQTAGGSFSIGSEGTLVFGKTGTTPEGQIILPDNVFAGNPAVGNLVINTADGLKLGNQSITIVEEATFINGDLQTNSVGQLIFSSTASLPVENQYSKIVGYAKMVERYIGTSSFSFLGYNIAAGIDDLGFISIERTTGPAGVNFNDDHESVSVTWEVSVDNEPENGRNVNMEWLSDFDNGVDVTVPVQIYRYVDGTEWEVIGGVNEIASTENGLRASATVLTTHFSEWTISGGEEYALPVSLVKFEGQAKGNQVVLNWTTASELNNDRFIVERLDGDDYNYVGSIKGKGTSTDVNNYQYIDANPKSGKNYYRLVQIDLDGKTTAYDPIAISFSTNTDFEVYPNPSSGNNLQIVMTGASDSKTSIKLYNAHGTLILEKSTGSVARVDVLDGKQLSKGIYYLELSANGQSNKRRVIIN